MVVLPCHKHIHRMLTERQLAYEYSSVDKLRTTRCADFVRWLAAKPADFLPKLLAGRADESLCLASLPTRFTGWLKVELQCEHIRATDALLDLPKPKGQVDQDALQQWCEVWLSEAGWQALKQRSKVAVLPRRT